MEAQKVMEPQTSTHNVTLTTFLPSQQVKHLAFIFIQAPKMVVWKGVDLRFVTGLATATHNTLRLYAIYQNATAFELSSWRLHEDIVGIVGWGKLIVVNTGQRIVGLRFEQNILKNSFMLSLQFLPLEDIDQCKVFPDKAGLFMIITIRNYLIFCLSQTLSNKSKARIQVKDNYSLVGEEVRWNDPLIRPYVQDVVKMKLADLSLGRVDQISISDQTVYFMGQRGKESKLYYLHMHYFYFARKDLGLMPALIAEQHQPPPNSTVIVAHTRPLVQNQCPDYIYFKSDPYVLYYKTQNNIVQINTYETQIKVVINPRTILPLLVWEPQAKRFTTVENLKCFQRQFDFQHSEKVSDLHAETMIYKQGILVTASTTNVTIVSDNQCRTILHKSIGNIIDFAMGRDMLFIQNYEEKKTRLFEFSRGPRVDPRPFVTHKKKMFLQQMSDLQGIFSIRLNSTVVADILAVKRGGIYTFYMQDQHQFKQVLEPASEIYEYQDLDLNFVLLRSASGDKGGVGSYDGKYYLDYYEWQGWTMDRRICLKNFIIANTGSKWSFLNIQKVQKNRYVTSIQIEMQRPNNKFIDCFFKLRQLTEKGFREHVQIEMYLVYSNLFEVRLLNLNQKKEKLIYQCFNPAQGTPILSNQLSQVFPHANVKDRYRSITCPEYCLSQHGVKIYNLNNPTIIAAHASFSQHKSLLFFVTSQKKLLIYRKYFSSDQSGLLLRRVCTPLFVIKNFEWKEDTKFRDLGQGVVKVGNLMLYKGQLLEGISSRSLFRMQKCLWILLADRKIRQVKLGQEVIDGFWIRQVDCHFQQQLTGIEAMTDYYCAFARKGFQIFTKDFVSHWRCQLGNETIVTLRTFEHYAAVSYYDYYSNQDGVSDNQSIRFRFRVYNCTTKTKIVERQKPLDQPILHIRFMPPDRIILVTSSVIFINLLKQDKTLEASRAHNFTSKRSFPTSFSHLPDVLPDQPGGYHQPTFMLFGGAYGGLSFYSGHWVQLDRLNEYWHEGLRCPIRHISFINFGSQNEQIKALVADDESNLFVLVMKSQKPLKIADIRLGSQVNSMKPKSQNTYIALKDGSIRVISAVKLQNTQVSYLDFQMQFCKQIPLVGGFNLRTSRQLRQQYRSARLVSKGNIIDCDILEQFFSMTDTLQQFIVDESQMQISSLKAMIPL